MILVSDSKQKAATEKFAAYLLSPPAQKVLAAAGFGKP
jgi:ABC-type molybdate transport system substrate-binding protein